MGTKAQSRRCCAELRFHYILALFTPSHQVTPAEPCARSSARRRTRLRLALLCLRVISASVLKQAQMDKSGVPVQHFQRQTQRFTARFYPSSRHIRCPILTLISCLKILNNQQIIDVRSKTNCVLVHSLTTKREHM